MTSFVKAALIPAVLAVSACGGRGDDSLGDNVADTYEAQADNLEEAADNASTGAREDALENRADTLREKGERAEDAIDAADVDARSMRDAQKEAITNKM